MDTPEIQRHYDPEAKDELPKWEQKRRLTRALRVAIERLVANDVPEDALRRAADAAENFAASLEPYPRLKYALGFNEAAYAGDVSAFFDQSPFIGLANPLAPPLEMGRVNDRHVVGVVTFGAQYEGPPGHVHGGFVAAAFDEVLGMTQSLSGGPGMTATLTVRYLEPTPLYTKLVFEGEFLRTERRKIFTRATVRAGDVVTAEAEGLFVRITNERREHLAEQRAARLAQQVDADDW
jgi:acyl-coenzyme A thioesterase PaaI-like protein